MVFKRKKEPKDKDYTKKEIFDLVRATQLKILKSRGIKTERKEKEFELVEKILKSNPNYKKPVFEKEVEEVVKELGGEPGVICDRCNSLMRMTGETAGGIDYHCNKCRAKKSIM